MFRLFFIIVLALLGGYFTYQEAGIATAIIISLVIMVALSMDMLRQRQDSSIAMLLRDSELKNNLIVKLESELNEVKNQTKELATYSERHEKWLDSIDRNVNY